MQGVVSLMLHWHMLILTASLLVLGAVTVWLRRQQRKETFEAILAPALATFEFRFVSAPAPRAFEKGPFHGMHFSWRQVGLGLLHNYGHYYEYRFVQLKDRAGEVREAWARLEFEGGRPARVTWRPELEGFAPPVNNA